LKLKRIRYISRFAQPLTRQEIDHITAISSKNNADLDVTGILMASGDLFFQIIEGPPKNIERLYRKIVFDPRHTDVLLLRVEDNVETRLFPDWSMRKIELDEKAVDRLEPVRELLVSVVEQKVRIAKLTHTLEKSIWREMQDIL
jgi:hypothetical protein